MVLFKKVGQLPINLILLDMIKGDIITSQFDFEIPGMLLSDFGESNMRS
jgi:hypothetical protein